MVEEKFERVANYCLNMNKEIDMIAHSCDLRHARQLVYADGVDLDNAKAVVPVGPTCRMCERRDCEQRAFPALQHRLPVHENVRGISFYAPVR